MVGRKLPGRLLRDYKAHNLNDTITILSRFRQPQRSPAPSTVSEAFTSSSAITGVLGRTPLATDPSVRELVSVLKGQGSTASNTTFPTSLTGQVMQCSPTELVVQAERQISMNNQHENIIFRGMVRPGDIGPGNTVPSAALSNLEIEMKGKDHLGWRPSPEIDHPGTAMVLDFSSPAARKSQNAEAVAPVGCRVCRRTAPRPPRRHCVHKVLLRDTTHIEGVRATISCSDTAW